jgi:hypothetical protein
MNQRIRELIKKATTVEYGVDNGFDRVTFDKEKFAELIVLECAETIQYFEEHNFPVSEHPVRLKKYFGVES